MGANGAGSNTPGDAALNGSQYTTSIAELASLSAMTEKDVHEQLEVLKSLRYHKGQWIIVVSETLLEQRERQLDKERKLGKVAGRRRIDPARIMWKPPVFTAGSRTWNW